MCDVSKHRWLCTLFTAVDVHGFTWEVRLTRNFPSGSDDTWGQGNGSNEKVFSCIEVSTVALVDQAALAVGGKKGGAAALEKSEANNRSL